jgi:hypothetical protein
MGRQNSGPAESGTLRDSPGLSAAKKGGVALLARLPSWGWSWQRP